MAGKSGGGRVYEMKIKLNLVLVEVEFRLRWAKFGKSFSRSVSYDGWDLFNDGLILFLLYRNTEIFVLLR